MNDTLENKEINYDDIPELTKEDFARGVKNPFAGKLKDGYTITIEHADYDEIITVSKKRVAKGSNVIAPSYVAESSKKYDE